MARFEDHVNQANRNLLFLQQINESIEDCFDWQVTTCFYIVVHLVNAHISKFGLQYRKHKDVKFALNPINPLSLAKLPEDEYVAFTSLLSLSRRARYLVNEKDDNLSTGKAFFTYDKHFAKAIRHLDKLLGFFEKQYPIKFERIKITCQTIKSKGELSVVELAGA